MSQPTLIAPSILAGDFSRLGESISLVLEGGADLLHLDFMDGHFVPNLSFGFPVAAAVAKAFPETDLDVHLMVTNPDDYIDRLAELGATMVDVHFEACPNLHRTLQRIRSLGMKAGVAFNPHMPLVGLEYLRELLDNILIMTVNPGFGGQSFLPEMLPKIAAARDFALACDHHVLVSVDGGVNAETARLCRDAGASFLVAGSSVFGSGNVAQAIASLREDLLV